MRPIGFVKCVNIRFYAKSTTIGKIYPYFEIFDSKRDGDCRIVIRNDFGDKSEVWMFLEDKTTNNHQFDFFVPPEFPKDTSKWTADDWFQYDLKYG